MIIVLDLRIISVTIISLIIISINIHMIIIIIVTSINVKISSYYCLFINQLSYFSRCTILEDQEVTLKCCSEKIKKQNQKKHKWLPLGVLWWHYFCCCITQ